MFLGQSFNDFNIVLATDGVHEKHFLVNHTVQTTDFPFNYYQVHFMTMKRPKQCQGT